ncbi:MarR family winged helix-turn-helix transcriptional regulator [Stigmatella aurantiaca]
MVVNNKHLHTRMTLAEQVASLRRTLHRFITRRLSKRTRRPFQQLLALKYIARQEARTQASLAERLMVDAPAASRLVDRLEDEGLVKRCAGVDRRCVRLEVTPASQEHLDVLSEAAEWVDVEASRHLSVTELSELKRLLEKVQTGMSQSLDASCSDTESLDKVE